MTLKTPPMGVNAPITGSVSGLPLPANQYKVGILVSSNNGATWWDKTHDYPAGVPLAVVLGIPLKADYTFEITGWVSDPNDLVAPLIRVIIVPQSFSFLWPGYQVEGTAYPQSLLSATVASYTVNRQTGAVVQTPGGGGAVQPPVVQPPVVQPPVVQPPVVQPPTTGAATLTITSFPVAGAATPISGKVTGVANPAGYKVVMYLQGGLTSPGTWWSKPAPGASTPIAADGTFIIAGWATFPVGDVNFQSIQIYIVPTATAAVTALGTTTLPAAVDAAAVAKGTYPKGYTPGAAPPAGTPVPPGATPVPPVAGKPAVTVIGIPAGSTAAITGKITGLTGAATGYKTVLYVQEAATGAWWGPKPQPAISVPVGADYSFTFNNWASSPNDVNVNKFTVAVLPAAYTAPTVLGAQLPAPLTTNAVAVSEFTRAGGAAQPPTGPVATPPVTPPVQPPATGGGGELAWPPVANPGPKVGQQGGYLNFAGYRWLVKETNGGRVGPGNNIFSRSVDHIWTDGWGLHMNIMPSDGGCGRWVCTEVILDHTLGYGTYLHRVVGPSEFLDPDVTWSPFFLWDDSGGAYNGWREVDFETARWGNAGDPTSSQFVLRPLQANGMVQGWKVRYETKKLSIWQGAGQGGGACNQAGQTDFNGAAVSKTTCALRWGPGKLFWYCADGHYTLQTLGQVPANKILGAYVYQFPQNVPDVGDNRVHINNWLQNGAQPRWGRRSHSIISGFEFDKNYDMTFPAFGDGDIGLTQRSLQQVEDGGRAMQEAAQLSNGDPTGQGMALTMLAVQADESQLKGMGVTQRLLAEASTITAVSSDHVEVSRLLAGAAIFGGLVGMATMFFAGYTVARGGGRKPLDFVKRALVGTPRSGGRTAQVAPVKEQAAPEDTRNLNPEQ